MLPNTILSLDWLYFLQMQHLPTNPNILYFQSGGPTSVINASFLGLIETYRSLGLKGHFYVSRYGVSGLLNGTLEEIDLDNPPDITYRPGSYFGSLRLKLEDDPNGEQALAIIDALRKYHIDFIFPNGGNDSMDTALKLSSLVAHHGLSTKVVGIPKTIDNDLFGCDHTPGFGTAAKYVINATVSVALDDLTYQQGRVNIIETMGRDSGFLAASSKLACLRGVGPDYIYVPEVPFEAESFLPKCKKTYLEKGRCLIVVSEGIRDKQGNLIVSSSSKDQFGHHQVGGVSSYLAGLLRQEGLKSRAIELSVLNRASSFLPSNQDIQEAKEVAGEALKAALEGKSACMICLKRVNDSPYEISYEAVDIKEIANRVVYLPKEYINETGDNILDSYIPYCLPLIQGNAMPLGEDGILG